jgi:prepilin-type N-terminal cleavage/methylation domain-containing protein/prepilin-type processing-associated H-X9-DG protein
MMKRKYCNNSSTHRFPFGFTLIELLVVIAIIALLLSILLPSLNAAKRLTKRLTCQSNLKQLAVAWHSYLDDYQGVFYRGPDTNHLFGGWDGTGDWAVKHLDRPLNEYVSLPLNIRTAEGAKVFRCPADDGGILSIPEKVKAYQYFGNSYQTNIILVGPPTIGPGPQDLQELHAAINGQVDNLKLSHVSTKWSYVPLIGDNNWMIEWSPIFKDKHSKAWHGKPRHHNLAFLDGHVEFLEIYKGLYVTPEYSIVPFRELFRMAREVQEEVEVQEERE